MIDSPRPQHTGPASAGPAPLQPTGQPQTCGGAPPPRLTAALLALALLQACSISPPKRPESGQRPVVAALFCSKPDCRTAFPPGKRIAVSTESPLSFWLYVAAVDADGPAQPRIEVDLSVVDLQGQPTTGAVVQPRHFDVGSQGRSQPITFLATTPGGYRIRAFFAAGTSGIDSPRIVVYSGAAQ